MFRILRLTDHTRAVNGCVFLVRVLVWRGMHTGGGWDEGGWDEGGWDEGGWDEGTKGKDGQGGKGWAQERLGGGTSEWAAG